MSKLISDLISALNGCEFEAAAEITKQINETGDEEMIREAEYLNSVI